MKVQSQAAEFYSELYSLGDASDLFYWGPSRAKPLYMSGFMETEEMFLIKMQ